MFHDMRFHNPAKPTLHLLNQFLDVNSNTQAQLVYPCRITQLYRLTVKRIRFSQGPLLLDDRPLWDVLCATRMRHPTLIPNCLLRVFPALPLTVHACTGSVEIYHLFV